MTVKLTVKDMDFDRGGERFYSHELIELPSTQLRGGNRDGHDATSGSESFTVTDPPNSLTRKAGGNSIDAELPSATGKESPATRGPAISFLTVG